mgnify:FL=1
MAKTQEERIISPDERISLEYDGTLEGLVNVLLKKQDERSYTAGVADTEVKYKVLVMQIQAIVRKGKNAPDGMLHIGSTLISSLEETLRQLREPHAFTNTRSRL